jgi:tRNA/tmRNA/rRNA uracil-C5-methylase (TrmA/RlmC/RlmD family)
MSARPETADQTGLLDLQVGPVAHGGHCVARYSGRVVFVRHALPGERVLARPEPGGEGDRFWRADAVEVLEPSPDRVTAPCPLAGPGRCGGCDWQHAALPAQRRLKAQVVLEQLRRLGGVDLGRVPGLAGLEVEALPVAGHGDDGLGWRTRMRFAVDGDGRTALRRHRSHELIPVPHCPIAAAGVAATGVGDKRWPRVEAVEVVAAGPADDASAAAAAGGLVQRLVVLEPARRADGSAARVSVPQLAADASLALRTPEGLRRLRGRTWVGERVEIDGVQRAFRVTGGGFWQAHPAAATALTEAVLAAAAPRPGERAADLYCGAGLFTAALALRVGPGGAVLGVESDDRAAADARRNLHDLPQAGLERGRVERVLPRLARAGAWIRADVVVLDPPRAGAGRAVLEAVLGLRPRVVVYVACDPASLARDVATAAAGGYQLTGLRALDLFPMTHHVECVATLEPGREPAPQAEAPAGSTPSGGVA